MSPRTRTAPRGGVLAAGATVEVGKSQRAYPHLRERIADGPLGPGCRLVLGQVATELEATTQVLCVVEGAATALSAPHLDAAALGRARALNAEMAAGLQDLDPRRFTGLNHDFHALLYGACPNEQLLELVQRGWHRLGVLRWSTSSFVPGRAAESVREHRGATLEAFLDHQRAGEVEQAG